MSESIRCRICGVRLRAPNEASHMRRVHPHVPFERREARRGRPAFYLSARAKRGIFALVAVVVLIVAVAMLVRSAERAAPIDPSAISVRVSMSGFSPNALNVPARTPLRINLINLDNQYHTDGGGWHDFVVEAFRMNVSVEPLGQRVFTVPTDTPGTYTWYCDLCCGGKESASMLGTIRVVA